MYQCPMKGFELVSAFQLPFFPIIIKFNLFNQILWIEKKNSIISILVEK